MEIPTTLCPGRLLMGVILGLLSYCAKPVTAAPEIYYLHNDHLGTPRVVTDQQRNVKWRADYSPFGETILHVDDIEMPLRMPGQYYDRESGLHYNYFRDYDPTLGQYIQSDPIGLDGGLNTYSYVGSNPLSYVDPYGLQGQMSRIKGRTKYDGYQRGNVVGSIQMGLLVVSASERGGLELGAAALPGFNASVLACRTPRPSATQCDAPPSSPVTSVVAGSGIVGGGVGGMPCVGIGVGTPRFSLTAAAGVR